MSTEASSPPAAAMRSVESPRSDRGVWLCCGLVLGVLALFVDKAFNVDDTLFLMLGDHLRDDPIAFFDFDVNWYGTPLPMHEVTKNPPLGGYFIGAVRALFGEGEVPLHLAFLLPAGVVCLATWRLAERLGVSPGFATCAGLLSPAFLVSSTSVMCDTLMLAFWSASVLLWVRGFDRQQTSLGWAAGALAALAFLTKYFGLALVPLLLAHGLLRERRLGAWALPLVLPLAAAALYQLSTAKLGYGEDGTGLLLDAALYVTRFAEEATADHGRLARAWVGLVFLGGCFTASSFVSLLAWPRWVWVTGLATAAGLGLAITTGLAVLDLQSAAMAFGGASLLALAVRWGIRAGWNAEVWLVVLWMLGTHLFAAHLNWVNNGRSNLPAAPVAGIVLAWAVETSGRGRAAARVAVGLGAAVALVVAIADYRWAGDVRSAVEQIAERHRAGARTFWYQGHWGFQYYMDRAGGRAFDFDTDRVSRGDVMVIPSNNVDVYPPHVEPPWMTLLETLTPDRRPWVQVMNSDAGAGFYASNHGRLPFSILPGDPDSFQVARALQNFRINIGKAYHRQGPESSGKPHPRKRLRSD